MAIGNVLTNDTLDGQPISPVDVTLSVVGTLPPEVMFNLSTGEVDLAPASPAGAYSFIYQACERINPGNCDTALVTINVPEVLPLAVNDTNSATVNFESLTDNNYFNANGNLTGLLGQTRTYDSPTYTITSNVVNVTGSIVVASTITAGSATIVAKVQRQNPDGSWTNVATQTFSGIISVLGTLLTLNLDPVVFTPGVYRTEVTLQQPLLGGLAAAISISTDVNVTYAPTVVGVTTATGNVLTNDTQGNTRPTLEVLNGGVWQSGTVTVSGTYGTLVIDTSGSYTYTPYNPQAVFTGTVTDTFQYRLRTPSGAVSEAILQVSVQAV